MFTSRRIRLPPCRSGEGWGGVPRAPRPTRHEDKPPRRAALCLWRHNTGHILPAIDREARKSAARLEAVRPAAGGEPSLCDCHSGSPSSLLRC